MNIAVLGLGYVGCVSAACLARLGHRVTGVDVSPLKVSLVNQGKSPIVEKQMDEIIADVVDTGFLRATSDPAEATAHSEISLICVGTPSQPNGSLDLQFIRNVARDVGRGLRCRNDYHVVAVRSTMLPGSIESTVVPLLEQESGKKAGLDFGVTINPEFLREGSAVKDYYHPPYTLVGACGQRSGDMVASLYRGIESPTIQTDIRTAEMIKYASNAFHALKVSFANEIGVFCKAVQVDSHKVMEIFARDTQLNLSAKYLRPGFAFGGSCLPKDVRALLHRAKSLDLDLHLLQAILPSNERHIEHGFRLIQDSGRKKVGVLGLSFKAGTDDLRESPMVHLVERLIGKGYDVRIFDTNVSMARIVGANKQYIDHVIPHVSTLLVSDVSEVLAHADVLVIGNDAPEFREILTRAGDEQQIIDLVRVVDDRSRLNGHYQGICW
jgi:GDP-mannose 6-dehydrogenase